MGWGDDIADHVEVGAGFVDAHQNLKLIGGLLGGCNGVGFVGFKLGELEVEALVVELGDVASLIALVSDVELVLVVGQVIVGQLFGGFGDDEVGEGRADGEDGLLDSELELVVGLNGGGAGDVESPATLFAALEEARDLRAVRVRVGGSFGGERNVGAAESEVRVGADASLDLLGPNG